MAAPPPAVRAVDASARMHYLVEMRSTPATFVIIALNVIMFIVELAYGAHPLDPTAGDLVALGGAHTALILEGEPWRLVSSMFLHGGAIHLLLNMVCLYQVRALEQRLGAAGFSAVYLVAGLLGGIASLLRSEVAVGVGASGAVFGLFGALGVILFLDRARMPSDELASRVTSLATFLGLNLLVGLSVPNIDLRAHVGGLVGGALALTALYALRARPRLVAATIVTLAGVGTTALALAALPTPFDASAIFTDLQRIEHDAIARFNEVREARLRETNPMPGPEATATVEREVVTPFRDARAALERLSDVPERFRPVVAATIAYLGARSDELALLARALGRERDEDAEADMRAYPALEERVRATDEALKAAAEALR